MKKVSCAYAIILFIIINVPIISLDAMKRKYEEMDSGLNSEQAHKKHRISNQCSPQKVVPNEKLILPNTSQENTLENNHASCKRKLFENEQQKIINFKLNSQTALAQKFTLSGSLIDLYKKFTIPITTPGEVLYNFLNEEPFNNKQFRVYLNENNYLDKQISLDAQWKKSLNCQLCNYFLNSEIADESSFSIAKELFDIGINNGFLIDLKKISEINPNEKPKEVVLSEKDAPRFFILLKNLCTKIGIEEPCICITESLNNQSYIEEDYTTGEKSYYTKISAYNYLANIDNEEIEFILAHELFHIKQKHGLQITDIMNKCDDLYSSESNKCEDASNKSGQSDSDSDSDKNKRNEDIENMLIRGQEREADSLAIQITGNAKAMCSCLLKIQIFESLLNITELPSSTHPTLHERLCYAFAQQ